VEGDDLKRHSVSNDGEKVPSASKPYANGHPDLKKV
jgi:hypothetical protein